MSHHHPPAPWAPTPRWLLLLLGLLLCIGMAQAGEAVTTQEAARAAPSSGLAIELHINGPIGPASTEYLHRGLEIARERNADLVILQIDTPGGLVTSLRDMNRDILASPIPVVTYVAPSGAQAASAGTYIVYASHLAAMAPGTNLGAATPIQMGGAPSLPAGDKDKNAEPKPPDPGSEKALNDAIAYIRSLADLQGRNADWGESAVREAASLPARAALEQNVVEIIAVDTADLLRQADGRTVQLAGQPHVLHTAHLTVETIEPDWRTRLLGTLTNPNLAYILLLLGIYGIIFELMSPGAVFPGVIGAVSLITALLALNMLPITYAGIGLLLLGVALMIGEAFVSSFGILGLAGVTSFVFGSVLLFDHDIVGFTLSLPLIISASAVSLLLLAIVFTAAFRAHRRPAVTGDDGFVGKHAIVERWQGDTGIVRFRGELWQATATSSLLPEQTVYITGRSGLTLTVKPIPGKPG